MKVRLFLSLVGFACLLSTARSQCDLSGGSQKVSFPDILKNVADSYIMGVEYSVPGAKQTDYYTEYYEYEFKRGRIDGHQAGENFRYIYRSETWESWNLKGNQCELKNITVLPDFFKDDMTDWRHNAGTQQFTTIGPSAMFKIAYDVWKKQGKTKTMAYMGKLNNTTVRGEKAVFFRRCLGDDSFVDYFFAADEEENAFDVDVFQKNITPLRVAFYNIKGEEKAMAEQFYDIVSFQHQIPSGVEPFELPKGRNCQRGSLVDGPTIPDFSNNNLMLSAEVLYRKISTKDNENEILSSYYSTLLFAIDREINHLAYLYSSWNTTKPDKVHEEPFLNAPKYIIYDLTHAYAYKIDYANAKCTISREKDFTPTYKLPEDGGGISLTDPYILFPNNELTYLSKGTDRGLTVNIFEAEIEQYILDADTVVNTMIVSHSYLTANEEVENTVAVRSSPTQIELHFFRKSNIEEILTFNIFGFTTKLPRRYLFDISRCYKNDDDYTYLTLGFEPEERYLPQLEKKLADVEENVLRLITMKSELNALRIPYIVTDVKDKYIYVTMLILGRPPLQLDFPDMETDMTIPVASEDDTQGVSHFQICANNCLETRSDCWGFSLCGATCYYGSSDNVKTVAKKGCNLYRRYNNESFIPSKELQVNNIVNQVEAEEFMTTVTLDSGERVELKATITQVTDPAEDDSLFEKMGNLLNPRMRILKAAKTLKKGSTVKNLGRLRYDECQKLCLDFKDCETLSYCLIDSACKLSSKYGIDLKDDDTEQNDICILLTRKYTDHFDRTPGVFVSTGAGTTVNAPTVEDCARECLKQNKFKCLSFDHCAGGEKDGCKLYTVHYLSPKAREPVQGKSPRCGHYSRKLSTDFKKKEESRIVGGKFQVITNLTMEECAKRCIEYSAGTCYGYDFCQDQTMFATSCTLIDTDPSRLKSSYSPICTNYAKPAAAENAPRPYSNTYAGGIGFLCFIIGAVVGAVVVFVIAYIRVNRR